MVRMVKPRVPILKNLLENVIKMETPGLHPGLESQIHLEICTVEYFSGFWLPARFESNCDLSDFSKDA